MLTVIPGNKTVQAILMHEPREDVSYKRSSFLVRKDLDVGALYYHSLTLELLYLSPGELTEYDLPAGAFRNELIRRGFLVPEDLDEHQEVLELREILRLLDPPKDWIERYTVFTTTGCNARCAYCFEKDWEPRSMTPEIADRAAKYMLKHSGANPFRIDWFGGEPLLNRQAMDSISGRLTQAHADFYSVMTTNGYLFDPASLRQVCDRWRLRNCQITLDGTEDRYNRIKNYRYPGVNAYRRVIENIHALADNDVNVLIRMNFDLNNYEDISQLSEELIREFSGERSVSAYAVMLYETKLSPSEQRSPEERARLHEIRRELTRKLDEGGLHRSSGLPRELPYHMCMADSGDKITILPDGHIGLCEQYNRDHFIGHIDREGFDQDIVEEFRAVHTEIPVCADCPMFPGCIPLLMCPNQICYPQRRDAIIEDCRHSMLLEWKHYCRKHPNPADSFV